MSIHIDLFFIKYSRNYKKLCLHPKTYSLIPSYFCKSYDVDPAINVNAVQPLHKVQLPTFDQTTTSLVRIHIWMYAGTISSCLCCYIRGTRDLLITVMSLNDSEAKPTNVGAIAGGVVGGVVE